MKMDVPFTRLPIRFDAGALAAEVDRVDPSAWQPHPSGFPGNDALLLVTRDGEPNDESTRGPMRPTPVLEQLPYLRQVLAGLGTVVGRSRLMRIAPDAEASRHVDTAYYWWDRVRVHVPIRTNPGVEFHCGEHVAHLAAGEAWVFSTWELHQVRNPGPAARVHLVVDTVGTESFWSLVEDGITDPDAEARFVPNRLGADLAVPFETVNEPVVMTPFEVDAKLDAALRDLARTEPEGAVELRGVLDGHRRRWLAAWATHGDRSSGWPTFTHLRDLASQALIGHEGRFRHANRIDAVEVIRNLVLRPAVNPDLAPDPGNGSELRPAPAAPTVGGRREPRIQRPVVIVSPPRSGSSLLFETLARSPDLYTIGGESHQLIESVPALRPDQRGWPSNALGAADATGPVSQHLHDLFLANLRDRNRQRPPASGPVRMLEKTPKNALRVPFLAETFPDVVFVYLYRDPRETISSMLDAWRSGRFVTYPELPEWDGPPWSLLLTPGWRDLIGRSLPEVVVDQWVKTTTALLDDLESVGADRWCVASYDRLVAEPAAEIAQLCEYLGLGWDVDLGDRLPDSRHTLDSPHPDKWRRNTEELESAWGPVRDVALRAHEVFADPPRITPVAPVVNAGRRRRRRPDSAEIAPQLGSVHSGSFVEALDQLGVSLLVSTYQSGRVVVVRTDGERLNTHFRSFAAPMGMARDDQLLAIGTSQGVWVYQNQPAVVGKLEPKGLHDACFMPRTHHVTGDIRIHDVAFSGGELWIVNTRFSCLATLDGIHSFVPRWRPPFISSLAPEDRCHLNGIALIEGEIRVASALGATDAPGGWRDRKADGGVLLEVPSGEVVAAGLSMPHSPRIHRGRLWVLESGHGSLATVDLESGDVETVAHLPGFTRGLSFAGRYAFVGLSQVREHLFGGLPLTEHLDQRVCGVWVVDIETGEVVGFLRFEGQVQEIYDIQVVPARYPELAEPGAELVSGSFVLSDEALAEVALTAADPRPV